MANTMTGRRRAMKPGPMRADIIPDASPHPDHSSPVNRTVSGDPHPSLLMLVRQLARQAAAEWLASYQPTLAMKGSVI